MNEASVHETRTIVQAWWDGHDVEADARRKGVEQHYPRDLGERLERVRTRASGRAAQLDRLAEPEHEVVYRP